jgi:hypothetical protein
MKSFFARRSARVALAGLIVIALTRTAAAEEFSCDVRARVHHADGSEPTTTFHEVKKVPNTTPQDTVLYAWDHFEITASWAVSVQNLREDLLTLRWRDTQTGVAVVSYTPMQHAQPHFAYGDIRPSGQTVDINCKTD